MRTFFKKITVCLLAAVMLAGCFACTPKPPFDTETPPVDTTEQPTEAVTDPTIPEVDRTKPQTGPFSTTTSLSFDKQSTAIIEQGASKITDPIAPWVFLENKTNTYVSDYTSVREALRTAIADYMTDFRALK